MCKMPGRLHSMLAMMILLLLLSYTTDLCGFSCWSCSRCNWTGKEINQAGGNVWSFVNLTFFTLHACVCLTSMKQWINVTDTVCTSLCLCIGSLAGLLNKFLMDFYQNCFWQHAAFFVICSILAFSALTLLVGVRNSIRPVKQVRSSS